MGRFPEILVLDDDPADLATLRLTLEENYRVHGVRTREEAETWLGTNKVPLALLDLNLGEELGTDILRDWKRDYPEMDVVFCSGETRVDRAVQCLREGAADYVVKPFDRESLRFTVTRALERHANRRKAELLAPLVQPRPVDFIGGSEVVRDIRRRVNKLSGQAHLNVMILGESGTGKEIVARLLHQCERDPRRPFVVANMPAIPANLMEAELFGVEKGAYTDAKQARPGRFEMADGGDIFLDEIGDLPLETQAKLLRTLQERVVERVGSTRSRRVEFRAISATNRPMRELISDGSFREDLMYRLSDMLIKLPPLREHPEDIPELAAHFLKKYSPPGTNPVLSNKALGTLMGYHWPGNVRQLESAIKRALVFNGNSRIEDVEILDLGEKPSQPLQGGSHEEQMEYYERNLMVKTLKRHRGNKKAAMDELRLSRATFYRKLGQLNIPL